MHQYEYDMGLPDHSVKPHEVFDMIIGTGSGGLLAAMLGPLKMTTQEALASLHTLYQSTFNPPASLKTKLFDFVNWLVFWLMYLCADLFSYKHLTLNSRATIIAPEILEKRLTKAIQELVVQRLRKDGLSTRLQEVEQLIPKCKFAVTAMSSVHVASPTVFRGYRSRTASPDCTLVDALRATLANARLFPAVAIGHPIVQTYIGADAGYPNPIETVLHEMETVYHHNYIAIILSVGSGRRETISIDGPTSFPEAIVKLVSSAQAASERVISRFSHHPEAYCRLDVDQLQYTTSPSPANVEVDSRAYLAREEVRQQLDALTVLMRSRPLTVKVCDIGRAKAGGLARAIQDIPIRISTHDSLKTLSYAERASFNPDLVCLKGTRTHILAIVFDWMEEAAAKPVLMWLEGVFGSGKSFVAHSVAVKAHQLGILGSSFFMTPCTTVRRVEGQTLGINEPASLKNLVTSLIIDLGALSETFRWTVGEILNHQPRLASATPSIQLAEVLLPSLSSLSKDLTFVWVIDGFDELMRYPDREAADRFFETLCSSLSDFPPNFLIFITSRPLPNHPLPQLPAIHHLMLDLLSPQNTQDLDLISYAELEELAAANRAFSIPSPDQQLAVAFRRKAGGHPLWLRIVREYLLTSLTPNEELEELLNLEGNGSSDYHQLMNLTYGQVITRSIDLNNSKNRKTLKHVIIVFLARQQPLPHSTLLDILNDSSELPPTTFRSVTSHLRPLLLGFNTTNPLEFIHLSLRDFFASSASFNDLIQDVPSPRDLSPGHFTLLRSAFRVMETHLRPEVPVERYHCDHPALAYSAAAWTTHLIHLDPLVYESQLTSHLSSFLDQSFMAWLVYHETLGLPFLFTHEFLEQAKRLAGHIWNEKVISRRDAVEKLDDLRQKFEYSGRFDHWRLCSDQAVQLWRVQAPSDIEGIHFRCMG
ncbi:hypothetical protein DL96DRAFT_890566 [Flagelloscypha sp. PMI_526]|nr:hypothetical protein DL96DRAFT_890566 [Flagelloscypha sp. PMI_526]